MKEYWLDANVALRFVLGEPGELAEKALAVFRGAEAGKWRLVVHPLVVAEIFYVLTRFYKKPKDAVAHTLLELLALPGVRVLERRVVTKALERAGKGPLSFTDAFLAEKAEATGSPVATFDERLRRATLAELPLDP